MQKSDNSLKDHGSSTVFGLLGIQQKRKQPSQNSADPNKTSDCNAKINMMTKPKQGSNYLEK